MTVSSGFRLEGSAKRVSAVDLVRTALRQAILRGDLPGGSQLVQTDIAAQLDVSTTPVREAMRDLASEGLITLDSHRIGTVRQLDWAEMVEIVDMRRALEPVAVQRAMEHMIEETLQTARLIAEELSTFDDVGAWVEKNNQFHNLFHEATQTERLSVILKSLEEAAGVFVAQAQRLHPQIRQRAVADHFALIEAYESRDPERVLAIQYNHLNLPLESVGPDGDAG